MKTLLVSFCNLPYPKKTALLHIDPISRCFRLRKLGYTSYVGSCTGITTDTKNVYVRFTSEQQNYIAALRYSDLVPIFYQALPEIKDGHSMIIKNEYLYIVSTGTDEVIRYTIIPNSVNNPQVVWRASTSGIDTHHINSITNWRGNLVVSAFGPKSGGGWSTALDGYIHDITNDVRIKSGIRNPHSVSVHGEHLYYCESQSRLFLSLEEPIISLDSYPRGISWLSDDLVCVGLSSERKISKSTGQILKSNDNLRLARTTGLALIQISKKTIIKQINLKWFGPEVYDILALEFDSERLTSLTNRIVGTLLPQILGHVSLKLAPYGSWRGGVLKRTMRKVRQK